MASDVPASLTSGGKWGFTLIEVLVALTISMVLMGLAWTGFNQMRQVARRNQAAVILATDAGFLYRRFADDVVTTSSGSQWRLETPLLNTNAANGIAYPVGSRAIRIIGLKELANRTPGERRDTSVNDMVDYMLGIAWYCWEYRPPTQAALVKDPNAPGSVWHGISSAENRTKTSVRPWVWYYDTSAPSVPPTWVNTRDTTFATTSATRRSRMRDLNDNDLRLVEGWQNSQETNAPAPYANLPIRVMGDRTDLIGEDTNLNGLLDPGEDVDQNNKLSTGQMGVVASRVRGFRLQWVDHQGWTTTADATGVSVKNAIGGSVASLGTAWWNSDLRVVDGVYRDGRIATADAPQTVNQARPAVVNISFTLNDGDSKVEYSYTFSVAVGLETPQTIGF